MAKLYIANPTRQRQVVCYRLDFNKDGEPEGLRRFQPARQQDVEPGRQVQLGGDMHMNQITDIVEQLAAYGLIGVVDVPRMQGKVTYLYSIDRPVPAEAMRKVIAHNEAVLIDDGKGRRMRAAVATNELVQQTVSHQFAERGIDDVPVDRTSVTFEQEEQSEAGEKRIAEGYKVSPDAPMRPTPRKSGGKATKPRAAA
jgi:hypothetical protein